MRLLYNVDIGAHNQTMFWLRIEILSESRDIYLMEKFFNPKYIFNKIYFGNIFRNQDKLLPLEILSWGKRL